MGSIQLCCYTIHNVQESPFLLCTTVTWLKMAAMLSEQNPVLCGIFFARDYTFFTLSLRVPIPDICPSNRMFQSGSLGLVIKHTHKSPWCFRGFTDTRKESITVHQAPVQSKHITYL